MFKLSRYVLLFQFLLVPVSLGILAVDIFCLDGFLKRTLPSTPDSLILFTALFKWPHIVAGSFLFFDKEYFQYYKSKLILPSIFFFSITYFALSHASPTFGGGIGFKLVTGLLILMTAKHFIGQQFGMASLATFAGKDRQFVYWKLLGIVISLILFFLKFTAIVQFVPFQNKMLAINFVLFLLFIPFTAYSFLVRRACRDQLGYSFIWATYGLTGTLWMLIACDYKFLFILLFQLVHDLNAVTIYALHDRNRNQRKSHNVIYRVFGKLGLPVGLLNPLLAVFISVPCVLFFRTHDKNLAMFLFVSLNFMHYYTDGFSWKRDSLTRKYVVFS